MLRSLFIEGPAGVGKTTYAIEYIRDLLAQGVRPEQMLVLVPQRTLGQPYHAAFSDAAWPGGATIDVVTLGGLARRGLETYWPAIAGKADFAQPDLEPQFLTIETAQYYMAGLVNAAVKTGVFDSVSLTPNRIMNQALDNLSKAAVNQLELDEIEYRLIAAWGNRHSNRPPVYRAAIDLARQFRAHCVQYSLLDFSLQTDLFMQFLLQERRYRSHFRKTYRHLVADNLDESYPIVADFITWAWDDLDTALLLFDTDGGYRVFLGADPTEMRTLADRCDEVERREESVAVPPSLVALANELHMTLDREQRGSLAVPANPRDAFEYASHKFYPQMINWVVDGIAELVDSGVSPREIVVLAPFLGDSLRFVLMAQLKERGIAVVSHRPSRAVRDEPAARAVLVLMALAHPDWGFRPPVTDVADALQQVITDLDPVRAWLLAQIVYHPGRDELGTFDAIQPTAQERITFRAGDKYERLRGWLVDYAQEAGSIPPDHFISRLFGEVLSQPGFGFHTNLDSGRVVAELVESARKFRQTLYPDGVEDWYPVLQDYFSLVQEGVLAALYVSSWRDEDANAVFLAPAHTFLMRNRWVDYQFWLDGGSNYWWERLEQPLTHPYVVNRNYPRSQVWTDELEYTNRRAAMCRLVVGLTRRCRQKVYFAISNLGEQGFEQRGPLLQVIQDIVQRYTEREVEA
ncbi:MAG: hypothetical protein GYB65_00140 [Chloroflexi bacterium]|nr:hypothetical protein [Chloroflexota bacterium]